MSVDQPIERAATLETSTNRLAKASDRKANIENASSQCDTGTSIAAAPARMRNV